MDDRFVTRYGCTVRVVPRWSVREERFNGDVVLILRMEQPEDGRIAEVVLTPEERKRLSALLQSPEWERIAE
jgi:hypothetical protein